MRKKNRADTILNLEAFFRKRSIQS